jgi:small-conductance mechanosensitive channel/CRP-like cAMP-binding protein
MHTQNNRNPFGQMLRATVAPVLGLCLLVLLDFWIRRDDVRMMYWDRAVSIAYILLGISLAYRLICSVALDFLLAKATGRQVPKILKHLIGITAVVVAILLSVNVLYSGAYTSLLALSSVIAVVIGLALRPIILDIFSGLSANLDAAFHIGDWIEISGRNGGSSYTGWVEEINWRTTHLKTRAGNLIICPNSTLSVSVITNFSRPSRLSRYDIKVELPPEIDLERARRILLAAVQATLDVENGPSSEKAPDVLITELEASGVEYLIRFWLDPSSQSQDYAQDLVSRSVLRHLQFAGIPLAENVILHRDKRVLLDMANSSSRAEVLGRAALFNGVQTSVLERLAEGISLHSFTPGENLIIQGAQDNEMYLLVEGAVDVIITVEDKEVIVARMQAGDYFGEMSLLTGEPRTATIRAVTCGAAYRIDRDAVAPVLESDPALMDLISRNLAERNLSRQAKAAATHDETPEQKRESFASAVLGKMIGIFRSARKN